MEGWWTPPPIHPPEDVPTCHRVGAERNGASNLPRHQHGTPRLDTRADVLANQLWDTRPPGRNKRAVQQGVPAEEAAKPSTVWARMGAGVSPGYSSSRRRALCHGMKEQRSCGQRNSSSALLCESPMPNPSLGDPLKAPLPGFREISQSTSTSGHRGSSGADATWSLDRTCHDHIDIDKDKLR